MQDMPDNNLFKFHEEKGEAGLCARKNESLGLVVQAAEHLSSMQALFAVYSTRIFSPCEG